MNGWQRIWFVLTAIWTAGWAITLFFFIVSLATEDIHPAENPWWLFPSGVAGWLLPPAILYGAGWAVAWIRRGFK